MAVVFAIIVIFGNLVLAIGLHEAAHVWAMRRYGVPVKSVGVGFFGIPVFRDSWGTTWKLSPLLLGGYASPWSDDYEDDVTPAQAAIIAFAGPLANLIIAFVIALIPDTVWGDSALYAHLNFLVALFNLLPVPPLDGGRILFAGIRGIFGNATTDKIKMFAYPLGLACVVLLNVWLVVYPPHPASGTEARQGGDGEAGSVHDGPVGASRDAQ